MIFFNSCLKETKHTITNTNIVINKTFWSQRRFLFILVLFLYETNVFVIEMIVIFLFVFILFSIEKTNVFY